MKLAAYLKDTELSDAAFARLIGVERQAVGRYKVGDRFPETPILLKIYEVTDGKVTANDFAGISEDVPAPPAESEKAS